MGNNYITITLNEQAIQTTEQAFTKSILQTADAIGGNIVQSKKIPYDYGTLQNSTHVYQTSPQDAFIEQNTPYARRMYNGDDFNFQTTNNNNAQSRWYKEYEDEQGQEKVANILIELIKRNSGGVVE